MKSYQQFFAELKRRHVFRVTGVYGIVAFGVLQVADIALPRLGLPDWTVTFMLAVILLAFPVVLMIAWAFEVTPEGVKKTDAAAPGEIEAIVSAPMSQRWPVGLLALVGVVALLGGGWWIGRTTAPGVGTSTDVATADVQLAMTDIADDERASIAVLPFADMSAAQDQEYFGDGMTEEILNTLARIRELRVAGRTSAFAYKGQSKDLREIGAELGVEYIVEGSVRKEGDDLRITAQLIDAADGSHLWSDSYDRPYANVFDIQREIAEAIAQELRVPLGLDANDLVRPTADLEAYDLYLAGRSRIRERRDQLDEAIEFFEAAIARDSSWAPAWAGLAEAKELIGWWDESWEEVPDDRDRRSSMVAAFWSESELAARRALELDPGNATANVALGSVLRNRYEWEESEEAYLRALATDPDNPEVHQQYGTLLLYTGRAREGRAYTARAALLDWVPIRALWKAFGLFSDERIDEGIEALEQANTEFPNTFLKHNLAEMYLATGRLNEVADLYDLSDSTLARLREGDADVVASLGPRFEERPQVWMGLGMEDRALAAAGPYSQRLEVGTGWFWNPAVDPIRDEPEMQAARAYFNLEGRTPDRTPR